MGFEGKGDSAPAGKLKTRSVSKHKSFFMKIPI